DLAARAALVAAGETFLPMIGRLRRRDQDRATDGIASVERALRSLDDFDLLDVEQFLIELRWLGHWYAVDHDRGGRLAVAGLADTTHDDEACARILRRNEGHIRHGAEEIGGRLNSFVLNRLGCESGVLRGHIVNVLGALARRD